MIIQHNISALNAQRNLFGNNKLTSKNLEKLSSGFRVNRAADDAAGLAISEKMRGQIRGLSMAEQNVQNGIELIKTAEGGLNETHSILQRMRELSVQSANGTYQDEVDREGLDKEFQALKSEIDRISDYTNYNGIKLLDGSIGGDVNEQLLRQLYGSWIKDSVELIASNIEIGFKDDINLKVEFKSLGGSTVAQMASSSNNKDYTLTFNADFLPDSLSYDDPSGPIVGGMLLDRIIAHEFTHAVMAHNSADFGALPHWYREGVAEAIHGASYRYGDFGPAGMAQAAADIAAFPASGEGSGAYTAGYLVVMYLDKLGGSDKIDALSDELKTNPDFKDAVYKVYGKTLEDIIDEMKIAAEAAVTAGTFDSFLLTSCGITPGEQSGLGGSVTDGADAVINTGSPTDIQSTLDLSVLGVNYRINITWPDKTGSMVFQIGANGGADQRLSFTIGCMNSSGLGIESASIATREDANAAIPLGDEAINRVSGLRAKLGAIENRLGHALNNLGVTKENLQSAESSIRDLDMAKEMMEYTKNNILTQAAQSMLAQANQLPQGVLSLLR